MASTFTLAEYVNINSIAGIQTTNEIRDKFLNLLRRLKIFRSLENLSTHPDL